MNIFINLHKATVTDTVLIYLTSGFVIKVDQIYTDIRKSRIENPTFSRNPAWLRR